MMGSSPSNTHGRPPIHLRMAKFGTWALGAAAAPDGSGLTVSFSNATFAPLLAPMPIFPFVSGRRSS